jgi:hypothetical protein
MRDQAVKNHHPIRSCRNAVIAALSTAALLSAEPLPVIGTAPLAGPDTSALSVAEGVRMSDRLASFMAQSKLVTVVERSQIDKVLREISLGQSGLIDESSAAKVGKMAGAASFVVGSYVREGGFVKVNARLVNTETGVVTGSAIEEGRDRDKLMDKLGAKLLGSIGITAVPNATFRVRNVLGWTSLGLGVAGAGAAIYGHVQYASADRRYHESYNLSTADYDAAASQAQLYMNVRLYSAVSAGVLLGTGAVLLLTNRAEWKFTKQTSKTVLFVPVVTPDGAGCVVSFVY